MTAPGSLIGTARAVVSRRRFLRAGPAAALFGLALTACTPPRVGGVTSPGAASPGTTGRGTVGLGIVGLVVSDVARSLTFYRALGLDVPTDFSGDSYRLVLPNGSILFWEAPAVIRGFDPDWRAPTGDRRVVLEFGFDEQAGLDATFGTLTAGGAEARLAPFWLAPEIRYAIVTDPDQNQISLRFPAVS